MLSTSWFGGGLVFKVQRLCVSLHSVLKSNKEGEDILVQGSGPRVQGSGSGVQGPGSKVQGSGFLVQGAGSRTGLRVGGKGCRMWSLEFRKQGGISRAGV